MNESCWIKSSKHNKFDSLDKDISVDTLIVGGGIVGVTTAYLLAKKGINVTLVDANEIGYGASGRNTGKITSQHGVIYSKIDKKYGLESAKLYYEGNNEALNLIEAIIKENNIECDFKRIDSYIFTQNENELDELNDEYEMCKKLNINCNYHEKLDLPIDIKGAISFKNQGQFNPQKYIDALLKECVKLGVKVYENTSIIDLENKEKCILKTSENNEICAQNVVISSHIPWYNAGNFYFIKERADRSYLVSAKLEKDIAKGMFLDTKEDGITLRTYQDGKNTVLIIGGKDHKVGQCKNEQQIYMDIKNYAKDKFGVKEFDNQWSAQDYMSYDHLPYIGYINKKEKNVYIATGFSKWGITNGTLSAILISELITQKYSKYENLFNPSRKGSFLTEEFYKENMNVGINYIYSKIKKVDDELPSEKGEATTVKIDGVKYGVYRHFNNELYVVDIKCTHLGCELTFNSFEKTWDCPCHASRFNYNGEILEGPAVKPLHKYGDGNNYIDINL